MQTWVARFCLAGFVLLSGLSQATAQQQSVPYAVDKMHVRIHVDEHGVAVIDREEVMSVYWKAAVSSMSQQARSYSSSRERLDVVSAWTQRPDGQRVDVDARAIREVDEYPADQSAIYSDQKLKVTIFSNVEPGARLHLHTRKTIHTPLYPGAFMHWEAFVPNAIYKDVVIELTHPGGLDLHVDARGLVDESEKTSTNEVTVHRYRYQQIQAQAAEQDSVSWHDFVPYFHASTFASVQALAAQYAKSAASREAVTPEIQRLAEAITAGIEDPLEQARAIYEWVVREIRYVGIYLEDSGVVPNSAAQILLNRYGDCKDHNTLLVSLLRARNIEAQAALVNAGESFVLPRLGIMTSLNHVITYIPRWNLFLDSTDRLTPFAMLPLSVMGKPAVLTGDQRIVQTPVTTSLDNRVISKISMKILPSGHIEGQSASELQGPLSTGVRNYLSEYDGESRSEMVRRQLAAYGLTGHGEYEFDGVWNLANPMHLTTRFLLDPLTNFPGEGAFSIPSGLAPSGLGGVAASSPPVTRRHPFFCSSMAIEETYTIEMPSEARISRIPDNTLYEDDTIRYEAVYARTANGLELRRRLTMDWAHHVCDPTVNPRFNRLLDVIRRDLRNQIFYR